MKAKRDLAKNALHMACSPDDNIDAFINECQRLIRSDGEWLHFDRCISLVIDRLIEVRERVNNAVQKSRIN